MQTCCEVQSLETSNVNNENQTQTIYFLGELNTFVLKMRNNCRENCSQFEKRDRGDLLLQGERTRCDPWFTQ